MIGLTRNALRTRLNVFGFAGNAVGSAVARAAGRPCKSLQSCEYSALTLIIRIHLLLHAMFACWPSIQDELGPTFAVLSSAKLQVPWLASPLQTFSILLPYAATMAAVGTARRSKCSGDFQLRVFTLRKSLLNAQTSGTMLA